MLYVSTRNTVDSFTAHRALHETAASDGGLFAPFRPITPEQIAQWKDLSATEAIALVLNRFFGLSLSGWDVECAIGRTPFQIVEIARKSIAAECWRNPGSSWNYLIENLYTCMCGKSSAVNGWARIAIEISLLFGLFTQTKTTGESVDLCVADEDFGTVAAALYAKDMGLPIGKILCVCNESGSFWDLIHRSEMATDEINAKKTVYFEYLLHRAFGTDTVTDYLSATQRNRVFRLDEEALPKLGKEITATVVSTDRVDAVLSSIYRSGGYIADPSLAFTYGGLQDYRASTGINNQTVLLGKVSPALYANRLTKLLNIGRNELSKQINSTKE